MFSFTPTVHLNGTSREALTDQLEAVYQAARALEKAMAQATPNARDYYPQGPDACNQARDQWHTAMSQVSALRDAIGELAERIA